MVTLLVSDAVSCARLGVGLAAHARALAKPIITALFRIRLEGYPREGNGRSAKRGAPPRRSRSPFPDAGRLSSVRPRPPQLLLLHPPRRLLLRLTLLTAPPGPAR